MDKQIKKSSEEKLNDKNDLRGNTDKSTDSPIMSEYAENDVFERDDDINPDEHIDFSSDIAAPHVKGEQSISGKLPDPSSDDDTLENAQDMGIGLDATEEDPQELNIASDIDEAEEYLRTH